MSAMCLTLTENSCFLTFLHLYFLFQKLFYSFVLLITMEDGLEFNTMEGTI